MYLIAFIFICLVMLALTAKKSRMYDSWQAGNEYQAKKSLLTPTELEFFKVLKKVVRNNETLFAKVRQADIIETTCNVSHPMFWQRFNRISQRHVDFVICDEATSRPLTVIELNDSSHKRPDRSRRDLQLRQALREASIKLIEIPANFRYESEKIKAMVYEGVHADDATKPSANQPIKNREPFLLEPKARHYSFNES
jgi:Protein of unknown function (DUF2726)